MNQKRQILDFSSARFLGTSKELLTCTSIVCIDVDLFARGSQSDLSSDLFAGELRDHTRTASVIVKPEHISPSNLMQNFDVTIECGGPCGISKVSILDVEQIGLQTFHLVMIELDDVA